MLARLATLLALTLLVIAAGCSGGEEAEKADAPPAQTQATTDDGDVDNVRPEGEQAPTEPAEVAEADQLPEESPLAALETSQADLCEQNCQKFAECDKTSPANEPTKFESCLGACAEMMGGPCGAEYATFVECAVGLSCEAWENAPRGEGPAGCEAEFDAVARCMEEADAPSGEEALE